MLHRNKLTNSTLTIRLMLTTDLNLISMILMTDSTMTMHSTPTIHWTLTMHWRLRIPTMNWHSMTTNLMTTTPKIQTTMMPTRPTTMISTNYC